MIDALIWIVAGIFVVTILGIYLRKFRAEQRTMAERKEEAHALGIDRPRAQFPMVDKSVCIGCGACVDACPEGDVLGVVWGVAQVINGERCVGHGYCEKACPVGALKVGLGDITSRPDIPLLNDVYETTISGIFIAGELGGISLIRNAIAQGRRAVEEIASRKSLSIDEEVLDVLIVGAGPAGLSAALTAIEHRLRYAIIDEREVGGSILHYPRRKLVMTQPVEIPLYGWLKQSEYSKEFLMETWEEIIQRFHIDVHSGERLESINSIGSHHEIRTIKSVHTAKNVVLAMGRRGTPRKLDVPGEESEKVLYRLIDTNSFQNNHMLVVGGGDSAVEAAVGLAKQNGNTVSISYRKSGFFRVKKKNEDAINKMIQSGRIHAIFNSQVSEIRDQSVVLGTSDGQLEIPNDFVIVQIGGVPPFEMLKSMGIRFGGEDKPLGLEDTFRSAPSPESRSRLTIH